MTPATHDRLPRLPVLGDDHVSPAMTATRAWKYCRIQIRGIYSALWTPSEARFAHTEGSAPEGFPEGLALLVPFPHHYALLLRRAWRVSLIPVWVGCGVGGGNWRYRDAALSPVDPARGSTVNPPGVLASLAQTIHATDDYAASCGHRRIPTAGLFVRVVLFGILSRGIWVGSLRLGAP